MDQRNHIELRSLVLFLLGSLVHWFPALFVALQVWPRSAGGSVTPKKSPPRFPLLAGCVRIKKITLCNRKQNLILHPRGEPPAPHLPASLRLAVQSTAVSDLTAIYGAGDSCKIRASSQNDELFRLEKIKAEWLGVCA